MSDITNKCLMCDGTEWEHLWSAPALDYSNEDLFEIKKCKECNFVRTLPFPENNTLEDKYQAGSYSVNESFAFRISEHFARIIERFKLYKISKLTNNRTLLEIGSGKGRFVAVALDHDWNAFGYEPFQVPRIKKKYRSRIYSGSIDQIPIKYNAIDTIVLWHVLEHMIDPKDALDKANKYLKPGGLLVLAVPNFDSLHLKISKGLWYHLDPQRHIWHFSKKSITQLLPLSGFYVRKINYFSMYQNIMGLWMSSANLLGCAFNFPWNLLRWNKNMFKKISTSRIIYSIIIHIVLVMIFPIMLLILLIEGIIKCSDTIEVYAVKKSN